jgi:prepilin peptidase CpaA
VSGALLIFAALALFTGAAAYIDLKTGHIPNRLVIAAFLVGIVLPLALAWLQPPPHVTPAASLVRACGGRVFGTLACGLIPLILFRIGAMGGGDVKLLAAVGTIAGVRLGLEIQLLSFVLIALYAPVRMAYEGRLLALLGNSVTLLVNPFLPKLRRRSVPEELLTSLPFGPAMLAATVVAFVGQLRG